MSGVAVVTHTLNALRGRGRWIAEFKASLVYRVSCKTARATQRKPIPHPKTGKNGTNQRIDVKLRGEREEPQVYQNMAKN